MSQRKTEYTELSAACISWWRGLNSIGATSGKAIEVVAGKPKSPDRAALAQLRRIGFVEEGGEEAVNITNAVASPALRSLADAIKKLDLHRKPDFALIAIAGMTLARVRTEHGAQKTLPQGITAQLLGQPRGSAADGANAEKLFAESRFKRLMRTRDDLAGLAAQARRVAAILENSAPVGDLGASLMLWDADPTIRRDWAFQYYQQRECTAADSE